MTWIHIPAGWFWMGSDAHFEWERPRRRVFVDAFEIASTTVTRHDYTEFLKATHTAEPRDWNHPNFSDPKQPVVGVSWFDAVAYCQWRGEYRLPTEAEWEKACRGGRENEEYAWGNDPPESLEYFAGSWNGPKRIGEWRPNGYGLFNMGENVHEWCSDWFDPNYYAQSPDTNPAGPESGARRVSRGGSWRHLVKATRAAARSSLPPEFKYTDYGFRLVRFTGTPCGL